MVSDGPDTAGYKAFEAGGAALASPAQAAAASSDPGPGKKQVVVDTGGGKLGLFLLPWFCATLVLSLLASC